MIDSIEYLHGLLIKIRLDKDYNKIKPMELTMNNYNNAVPVIEDDHTWYTDKKLSPIKIVRILRTGSGDWAGLYVDGVLTREGHSLNVLLAIMDVLGADADVEDVTIKDNYLDDYGNRCPRQWPYELEMALDKKSNHGK